MSFIDFLLALPLIFACIGYLVSKRKQLQSSDSIIDAAYENKWARITICERIETGSGTQWKIDFNEYFPKERIPETKLIYQVGSKLYNSRGTEVTSKSGGKLLHVRVLEKAYVEYLKVESVKTSINEIKEKVKIDKQVSASINPVRKSTSVSSGLNKTARHIYDWEDAR